MLSWVLGYVCARIRPRCDHAEPRTDPRPSRELLPHPLHSNTLGPPAFSSILIRHNTPRSDRNNAPMVSARTSCCGYSTAVKNPRWYCSEVTSSISPTIKTATIEGLRHSLTTFQSQFLFRLEWTSPPPVRRALGFPSSCGWRVSCNPDHTYRPFFGVSSMVFFANRCSRDSLRHVGRRSQKDLPPDAAGDDRCQGISGTYSQVRSSGCRVLQGQ